MIFWKTLAVFLSTIIGVGIFSLPFVAKEAGFPVMLGYFLFMTPLIIFVHLIYAEIALGTEKLYRLPGYAGAYLGDKWKAFAFIISSVGMVGALLVYFVIGGSFLNSLFSFSGASPIFWTFLFFILGAYFIMRDIKPVSKVGLFFLAFIIILFSIFLIKSFNIIDVNNFKNFNPIALTLPYGVILFSLWGTAIIPELEEMLAGFFKKKTDDYGIVRKNLKKVIWAGIIISALIYILFIIIIFGVLGQNTPKDALSGLAPAFGNFIFKLGLIFGVMSCFTSFLVLGLTFKKMLRYDFGFSPNISWFLACFIPLFFFLLGLRGFIKIIGFTGAISMGIEGIIIIILYRAFLKKKNLPKANPFLYFLGLLFILGVFLEIFYFIKS